MGRCRDCGTEFVDPSTGKSPCRCQACADKHNARNKRLRAAKRGSIAIGTANTAPPKRGTRSQTSAQASRILKNVRTRILHAVKNQIQWHETTEQSLGCSIEDYREYIEKQFEPEMTWDNWGKWSIDHIKPVSSFNLVDPVERLKAFHFTNTKPIWTHLNLQKSAKIAVAIPAPTAVPTQS